jgi:DNA modification methylase
MGFDFVGCEIDKEYYDMAVKIFNERTDEGLFKKEETVENKLF